MLWYKVGENRRSRQSGCIFITEFPEKGETKEKKFLAGAHGEFFHEILRVPKEQTGFAYAISGVPRGCF